MKGVILTAGNAKRLRPITNTYGKVLVPIYNKPMIFYGVCLLLQSGIRDIAFVCNEADLPLYKKLFDKKYKQFGINFKFFVQKKALGTANALVYAQKFVGKDDFVLLFGDNIFVSNDFSSLLKKAIKNNTGLTLFAKRVPDPERFGVIQADAKGKVLAMEEKPQKPKSDLASTGLYVFRNEAMARAKVVPISPRGEKELTDVTLSFVGEGRAKVITLPDECVWLDSGTFDSLLDCSKFVKQFEAKNGLIGCIELEMYKQKIISMEVLKTLLKAYSQDYQDRVLKSIKKL